MNRRLLLCVLVVFSSGFLFSSGFASISANMELDSSTVTLDDTLSISYSFQLGSKSMTNFAIKVGDLEILNNTYDVLSMSDVLEWDVGNTPAGDYKVYFMVISEDESATTSENLIITAYPRLNLLAYDSVYMFEDFYELEYRVMNTGNIPLRVNVDPEGDYFYSVSPINFNLGVNESRSLMVNVTKPEQDTTMSITFTGTNATHETTIVNTINLIIPSVSVIIDNISFTAVGGGTQVIMDVRYDGNMPQNFTFNVTTTSLGGTQTFSHVEEIGADSRLTVNFTIPSTDKVSKVEVFYTNSMGVTEKFEQRYDTILPGLGAFIDVFYMIWNSELLRGVLITLVILLILILLWKIWRRKK